jgi:AraC-like DNA-binding protein
MTDFVPVKHLYKLAELIKQEHDLDINDHWERQGLTLPKDPSGFVREAVFISACKLAIDSVDDPALGLKFGRAITVIQMGALGAAMMSCANLAESFTLALKYKNGFTPHTLNIQEKDDSLWISPLMQEVQSAYAKFDLLVFSTALIQSIKELLQYTPSGIKVHFPFSKPNKELYKSYRQSLSAKLVFNQNIAAVIIPKAAINEPLPSRDDVSKSLFIESCQNTQKKLSTYTGLTDKIYKLLGSGGTPPSLDQLAQTLNISSRTLRYQLKKEGANYRKILTQYRLKLAADLLQTSDISIKRISEKVGYQDLPSFYRTFKKEMGVTPAEYRNQNRR